MTRVLSGDEIQLTKTSLYFAAANFQRAETD